MKSAEMIAREIYMRHTRLTQADIPVLEDIIRQARQEGYQMAVEDSAKVAEYQATICGSSLSRQSTSHDIASNIRSQLKYTERQG